MPHANLEIKSDSFKVFSVVFAFLIRNFEEQFLRYVINSCQMSLYRRYLLIISYQHLENHKNANAKATKSDIRILRSSLNLTEIDMCLLTMCSKHCVGHSSVNVRIKFPGIPTESAEQR